MFKRKKIEYNIQKNFQKFHLAQHPLGAASLPVLMPILVLLLLLWGLGGSAAEAQSRSQIEADLQHMNARLHAINTRFEQTLNSRAKHRQVLHNIELQLVQHHHNIARINSDLDETQERQQALSERRHRTMEQLQQHQKVLARLIQTVYVLERRGFLLWLLQQQSPTKINRILGYHSYFSAVRRKHIKQLQGLVDETLRIDHELKQQKEQLSTLLGAQQQVQQDQQRQRLQRKQVLTDIKAKLNKTAAARQLLLDEQKLLHDLLAKLDAILSEIPDDRLLNLAFIDRKGKLPWPLKGQLQQSLRATTNGDYLYRQGVLLTAPEGATVRSIHHGRVVYANWLLGFGLLLVLDHGDGYMSLYGHAARILREVGEWVNEGDPIALVGNTGGQQEAGLYFAIRSKGVPRDPESWCRPTAG